MTTSDDNSTLANLLTQTITSKQQLLAPPDEQLAEAMRKLAWKAYEEGMMILEAGSPSERTALIRLILSRTMGLVGTESTQHFEIMREEFYTMMDDIRGTDAVLEPPLDDAEIIPAPVDAYDPDEGIND